MSLQDELLGVASALSSIAAEGDRSDLVDQLQALEDVCLELKRSASGSWLGHHAFVYYAGLQPAPPGANFSQEFGLQDMSFTSLGSTGDWRQFDPADVKAHVFRIAGVGDLGALRTSGRDARSGFQAAKTDLSSIYELVPDKAKDGFIKARYEEIVVLTAPSASEITNSWHSAGRIMTRDMVAAGQGWKAPPHLEILAEVFAIRVGFEASKRAAETVRKMANHLRRKKEVTGQAETENRIFIGHGHAPQWRELKDFLGDRLQMPWDEFNRLSAAGVPTVTRLSDMLSSVSFAFLVLTGEDETGDGALQARMNVVHEVGLFQGRLGFSKAIVLLEEGCEEFSNIVGLGQIRFPRGNISAAFEEVRRVLEREGQV